MRRIHFRASSLADIMTDPKGKDEILSVGAKTAIRHMAKEMVYGFTRTFSSKYTEKGLQVENESIALYNSVHFTNHVKNTERKTNEWITGECDIAAPNRIIDIKSSWSLDTFPALSSDAIDKAYEWQGRAYMMLWEKPEFEVAHCLVNTPDELVGWDPPEYHFVSEIPEVLRVTSVHYTRDLELEEKIKTKVDAANDYLNQLIQQIAEEHQ